MPTDKIIETVIAEKTDVLGLSALLTVTVPEISEVIGKVEAAGLREKVKVIVGANPITEELAKKIGADYRTADAIDGKQVRMG